MCCWQHCGRSFFSIWFLLNLMLCASLLLLHSAFFPPLFYLWYKFYFLSLCALSLFPILIIAPPSTLWKSFFFQLVISYSFFFSFNSLDLFTPLLIFSHLLLIVWLWVGVIFAGVVCFLGCLALFWQHLYTVYKMWWAEWLSVTQLEGRTHQRMTQ